MPHVSNETELTHTGDREYRPDELLEMGWTFSLSARLVLLSNQKALMV